MHTKGRFLSNIDHKFVLVSTSLLGSTSHLAGLAFEDAAWLLHRWACPLWPATFNLVLLHSTDVAVLRERAVGMQLQERPQKLLPVIWMFNSLPTGLSHVTERPTTSTSSIFTSKIVSDEHLESREMRWWASMADCSCRGSSLAGYVAHRAGLGCSGSVFTEACLSRLPIIWTHKCPRTTFHNQLYMKEMWSEVWGKRGLH